MKKFISIIILFLFSISVSANEIFLANIAFERYIENIKIFKKEEFKINYDVKEYVYYIFIPDTIFESIIKISPENINKIVNIINKYFEWNKKATLKKVKIEKKIDTIEPDMYIFGCSGEWFLPAENPSIDFYFFSENQENHKLVLVISKMYANNNQYITYKPKDLYLSYEQIKKLKNCLSNEFLNKKINEFKKQKEIENEFE